MLNNKKLKYQFDYSSKHSILYNESSRYEKADRIVILLNRFFSLKQLKNVAVLDIGCSTGIIDYRLSKVVKTVTCVDIDKKALDFARKNVSSPNLEFKLADAMALPYKGSSFDIVVCTQVYEHVPDQKKLFSEIFRVLKKRGICYFAAVNKLSVLESHYNLPFLSLLPKSAADLYVKILKRGNEYYEKPLYYWQLKRILKNFKIIDFTSKILRSPNKFGYETKIFSKKPLNYIFWLLSPLSKYISSTFIWVLIKE